MSIRVYFYSCHSPAVTKGFTKGGSVKIKKTSPQALRIEVKENIASK